jgi:hypothetical protein
MAEVWDKQNQRFTIREDMGINIMVKVSCRLRDEPAAACDGYRLRQRRLLGLCTARIHTAHTLHRKSRRTTS